MAQLVIKGHQTRGKEVIEILEMLGGNNPDKLIANFDYLGYFIGKETRNIYLFHLQGFDSQNVIIFTLEEFLEKFPYKVGYKAQHSRGIGIITSMHWDDMNNEVQYNVCVNNETWLTSVNFLKHCKEKETMEENLTIQDIRDNNAEWLLNKLQKMSSESALQTINDLYGELHKPQYPKTYAECCDILSISPYYNLRYHTYEYGYSEFTTIDKLCSLQDKLNILGKLLICRDAYWKMAGEQMGLGEPWKPNWLNTEQDKFILYTHNNVICSNRFVLGHNVLAFPTKEMRDIFYENFKDLIEQCKDFL